MNSQLDFTFNETYISKSLKDLKAPNRISMCHEKFINSAIAFLIIPNNPKPYELILIKRAKIKGDRHSGEMSFPGGKFDEKQDKDPIDTALRELEEEIGISREKVNVLGCLDDHITPKGYIITPIVCHVSNKEKMVKQDTEVKEIINVPITFFANEQNYKERTYKIKQDLIAVGKYVYHDSDGKKYVIFGATSHIIVSFLKDVYNINLMTKGARRIKCEDIENKIIMK